MNGIRDERGFTLMELVVTAAFVGIVIVSIADLFIALRQVNVAANNYMTATEVAQQQMETLRNTAYSSIPLGTTDLTTALLSAYGNLKAPRSASETVSYIDNSGNASGSDVGLKKVDVAVSYTDRTGTKNVQYSTWIGNKGLNP